MNSLNVHTSFRREVLIVTMKGRLRQKHLKKERKSLLAKNAGASAFWLSKYKHKDLKGFKGIQPWEILLTQ